MNKSCSQEKFKIQLIKLIKKHPILYDKNKRSFCENFDAWNEIATVLNCSIEKCKTDWKYLKTTLFRFLRENARNPKAGGRTWKYYDYMSYLLPHIDKKCLEDLSDRSDSPLAISSTDNSDSLSERNESNGSQNCAGTSNENVRRSKRLKKRLSKGSFSYEELIGQVKRNECLYNQKFFYFTAIKRRRTWERISQSMGCSVKDSKNAWRRLRQSFCSVQGKKDGSSIMYPKLQKYHKAMSFMLPFIARQSNKKIETVKKNLTHDNLSNDHVGTQHPTSGHSDQARNDDNVVTMKFEEPIEISDSSLNSTEEFSMEPSVPPQIHSTMTTEAVANIVNPQVDHSFNAPPNQNKVCVELDELDLFFYNMGQNVKKFSQLQQTKIKMRLHRIIYEADLECLQE